MVDINLAGPDGNAFSLLNLANKYGLQMGLDKKEIDNIITEMQSNDYDHLIETFKDHFGDYVNIIDPDDKGVWTENKQQFNLNDYDEKEEGVA